MELNPIDVALQSVTPTVMVPRHTAFEELKEPGHRFLMAANGLWLEARRAWLYLRMPLTQLLPVPVPYGQVTEELIFRFGKLPKVMVTQFIEEAKARSPNECAAWVIWNQRTTQWRLLMLEETAVGKDFVHVNRPVLEEDEYLVIDLHSHGEIPAFFSGEDNEDDLGEVKISGVIGNLNEEVITTAFRLCANGLFIPLPFDSPQG